jgi:hypothetical protein
LSVFFPSSEKLNSSIRQGQGTELQQAKKNMTIGNKNPKNKQKREQNALR